MPVPKPKFNPFQPDMTYLAQTAQGQAGAANSLAGINRTASIDQSDTSRNLQRLAQRQVQSQQSYNANASRNGSLMSGKAMQGFGYMNQGYQQQNDDMANALSRRSQDRAIQTAQINQGLASQDMSNRASLVDRNRQRLAQVMSMMQPTQPYQQAYNNYWAKQLQQMGNGAQTVSQGGILR